jgi:NADPH-dependent curcumin reductase CurA
MQGFVIIDPQWKDDVEQSKVELGNWVAQGKLRPLKTVWRVPFEEIPKGLTKLLHGDNVGKLVTELEL